jgi:hypothetical protein
VPSRLDAARPPAAFHAGVAQPGDTLVLASDALAAWLLRTNPAQALATTAATFPDDIQQAHDDGVLRNDDVTLVVLPIEAAGASPNA